MLELNTCRDAETAAQSLQLHFFSSRELSRCIPPDFITRALMLVLYLLPYMKPRTEYYVRGKLDMFEAPAFCTHSGWLSGRTPEGRM